MASDTAVGGLCVNSPRDLREERVAVDNNAFLGGLGFTPSEKARALPFALKYLFFALCKFYRFSMGVL